MKETKIYNVLFQWDDDGDQNATIVGSFLNKDKAIEAMKEKFNEELTIGRWAVCEEEDKEIEIEDNYCNAIMTCDSYWLNIKIEETVLS